MRNIVGMQPQCNTGEQANGVYYTPVIRVDDYPADADVIQPGQGTNIFWDCMPVPGQYSQAVAVGGDASESNGRLYLAGPTSDTDSIINTLGNSTDRNRGIMRFVVWDPATGKYSRSHDLQASDWQLGMTQPPGEQLKATIYNIEHQSESCKDEATYTNAQITYDSDCLYMSTDGNPNNGVKASGDLVVDTEGNMYVYASSNNPSNQAGVTEVLKITSSVDNNTILDNPDPDSSGEAWRYSVVMHTRQGAHSFTESSSSIPVAYDVNGFGADHGNFLLGGATELTNVTPLGWNETLPTICNKQKAETNCNRASGSQVRIDRDTGVMEVIASTSNAIAVVPNNSIYNFYPANNGQLYQGNVQTFDIASSYAIYIVGNVYDDENAAADYNDFKPGAGGKNHGVAGLVVDVFDGQGTLVGATTTNFDGYYQIAVPSEGDYYVRLVQPKVGSVNAYQTWTSVSDGVDADDPLLFGKDTSRLVEPATATCINIDSPGLVDNNSGLAGKACQGAQRFPYIDPNPPLTNKTDWWGDEVTDEAGNVVRTEDIGKKDDNFSNGASGKPSWAHYGKVTINKKYQLTTPIINFAVSTARGSYGDASGSTDGNAGPFNTTKQQKGPFFLNPNLLTSIFSNSQADSLQLGNELGDYSDGMPDANANSSVVDDVTGNKHTETDDGIEVVLPADASKPLSEYCSANPTYTDTQAVALQGITLNSGYPYCIKATVKESLAALNNKPSVVVGWQSPVGSNASGGWSGVNPTLAYAQWANQTTVGGAGDTKQAYGTLIVPQAGNSTFVTELRPVQTRFTVMSNNFFINNGGSSDTDSDPVPGGNIKSDNTGGIYNGPAVFSDVANEQYWVQPGEVEDYQYRAPLNTPTIRILAHVENNVGDAADQALPLNIKYRLALNASESSTWTDDEINVNAFAHPVSSATQHVVQSEKGENGVIVTTGMPLPEQEEQGSLVLDVDDPFSCEGSYASGSTISTVGIPTQTSDISLVPQPDGQEGGDTARVSYFINTDASSLPQNATSSTVITCRFNYELMLSIGELPNAGAFPWLSATGVALLVVGTIVGTAYVVVLARKRSMA